LIDEMLLLSEEQESIRRSAKKLVEERAPIAQLRALRDASDPVGYSRELWAQMAELGFAGMTVPEAYGGAALGLSELGLVLEECGRQLVASPLFGSLLLGGAAIARAGSESQKNAWLPRIARGDAIVTLAHDEGSRHARYAVATRAERIDGGFAIHGEKTMVIDGHVADAIVVVARARDRLTLYLVPRDAKGLHVSRRTTIDSRNVATVRFDGVHVSNDDVVGMIDRGSDVLDAVLDRAAIGLSAEMLGGMQQAFDLTIAYLKVRKQFGVAIGSFQALKHRAAQLFCDIEQVRSLVLAALRAADADSGDLALLASAAKARASDVFVRVANEAVQMHGGIGVTDDLDIGFYLKRARVAEMTLGAASFHRDRFARLSGY
jgi:alkylation response protein AidB-like acyl-CoA dehydrogenase